MRLIGFSVAYLLLAACTIAPLFPHDLMKDVASDPFVLKAWEKAPSFVPGEHFVPQKVALGGQIMKVIPRPDAVVILTKEQPLDKFLGYGPTRVPRADSFNFAIVFDDSPDVDLLQPGNQLAVLGVTEGSSLEGIDETRRILPHLLAQCLNIWKTDGFESEFAPYESTGHYPLEKRAFCRNEDKEGA